MGKKPNAKHTGRRNYELKSDAVEELAGADAQPAPEYSQEELNKYRSGTKFTIPRVAKLLLIKAWFAGAVCFFILWGLGTYIGSTIDMLFVLGVVLGMVTDLLTNNVLRFIERTPGENDDWLLVTRKGMGGFVMNLLFGLVIIVCVYGLYNLINLTIVTVTHNSDTVPLGVEPFLFGAFCMGFDMLFIGLKQLLKKLFAAARAAVTSPRNNGRAGR